MKVKPWQVALIVVGLLACAASIIWTLSNSDAPKINHVLHYVDVETGDIYGVDLDKQNIGVPARNPETGKMSLVRLAKKDGGGWCVDAHDRGTLRALDKGVQNKVVDEKTGDLIGPAKDPVAYVRKY
jgi:hypothetical protein